MLSISLLYLVVCVASLTEGYKRISKNLGSRVTLQCNQSRDELLQLTWKKDGVTLYGVRPGSPLHANQEANRLNISKPEPPDYALVIDPLLVAHRGNYTCEMATSRRTWEEKWELDVTETTENDWLKPATMIIVTVMVPSVCGLIFIISLTALLCRRHSRTCGHSSCGQKLEEREEDIYENCLDVDLHHQHHKGRHIRPIS